MSRRMGGRAPDSRSISLPAPVGGLNDRDPIVSMPAADAIILENWWPEPGRVSIRRGCLLHTKDLLGPVETLVSYWAPDGDIQILAGANGNIYDVTYTYLDSMDMFSDDDPDLQFSDDDPVMFGEFENNALYVGGTSGRYQVAETTTAGGSFQLWMNGEDEALLYDGTSFTPINANSTPSITGVNTEDLIDGVVFKNRLFLVEKKSMNLWYLPVTSIAGAANDIPMGQIFRRGGYIVTAQSWTIDAGEGSDDLLVVLSSNGEAAVFQGIDPSDASNWKLIGVFYIGRPIGQRPCVKFGGDLLIICEDGVFPLSGALNTASVDGRVAITDKIQNTLRTAARSAKSEFGWQLCQSPINSALILNVPDSQGKISQYIQNTLTGAWTKFTGWHALCWLDTPIGLFFGDEDGNVKRAWESSLDEGESIVADACQAFSDYRSHAEKYFNLAKFYIESNGTPAITYSFNGDFVVKTPDGELAFSPTEGMIWGQMVWGSMTWGEQFTQMYDWRTIGLIAKSGAPRIKIQNNGSQVNWASTDVMYSRGWAL